MCACSACEYHRSQEVHPYRNGPPSLISNHYSEEDWKSLLDDKIKKPVWFKTFVKNIGIVLVGVAALFLVSYLIYAFFNYAVYNFGKYLVSNDLAIRNEGDTYGKTVWATGIMASTISVTILFFSYFVGKKVIDIIKNASKSTTINGGPG